MPRTRTGSAGRCEQQFLPAATVPAGRVPVTTVPLPLIRNARSTHSRTGAAGVGCGRRAASRPAPPGAGQALAGAGADRDRLHLAQAALWPRSWSRAPAAGSYGSARSARVTTSRPWLMPRAFDGSQVLLRLRHPALVGGHGEQDRRAPPPPRPACWAPTVRAPGTSTNATCWPVGSVSQANPRSMVSPRRRSWPTGPAPSGQGPDQRGLTVIDVPGGRYHLHAGQVPAGG